MEKKSKAKKVKINGVDYIKKNGKLYSMPRTVTNRKILRNRLRMFLKAQGYAKINRVMKQAWQDKELKKAIHMM